MNIGKDEAREVHKYLRDETCQDLKTEEDRTGREKSMSEVGDLVVQLCSS